MRSSQRCAVHCLKLSSTSLSGAPGHYRQVNLKTFVELIPKFVVHRVTRPSDMRSMPKHGKHPVTLYCLNCRHKITVPCDQNSFLNLASCCELDHVYSQEDIHSLLLEDEVWGSSTTLKLALPYLEPRQA